jgi:hypothetical protein
MKGKQAILRYLETHRTFTAKDVATECGMTINCITKNALDLERARQDCPREQGLANGDLSPWRHRKSRPAPRVAAPTEYFRSAETAPADEKVLMVCGRAGV